jgi:programmed cell death protein 5
MSEQMNEELSVEQMQQIEQMKKLIMKKLLSKEAVERLARLKLVKPEIANQLELYLLQLYESGKITNEITDEQLKAILGSISSKKQFKIIR